MKREKKKTEKIDQAYVKAYQIVFSNSLLILSNVFKLIMKSINKLDKIKSRE